jgi:transcription initiation factor TFIIIB Brf1 subunit/transcription initiation factor TFIIB
MNIHEEIIEEVDCNGSDYDSDEEDQCRHKNKRDETDGLVCVDCGEHFEHNISQEKEWRFYGSSDSRSSSNPSRCHMRKGDDKSIYNDVVNMGFPPHIIKEADDLYRKVTKGNIHRGQTRKSLIFNCVFYAYKRVGKPQSPESIAIHFNLKKKTMSTGRKILLEYLRKSTDKYIPTYTTPINLVPNIMKNLRAGPEHLEPITKIYDQVKDRSTLLKRSNPQSTAAGLVYYYCRSIGKKIVKKEFSATVCLSDITITKIAREISQILCTDDTIRL